jgi:hypothetical protein
MNHKVDLFKEPLLILFRQPQTRLLQVCWHRYKLFQNSLGNFAILLELMKKGLLMQQIVQAL